MQGIAPFRAIDLEGERGWGSPSPSGTPFSPGSHPDPSAQPLALLFSQGTDTPHVPERPLSLWEGRTLAAPETPGGGPREPCGKKALGVHPTCTLGWNIGWCIPLTPEKVFDQEGTLQDLEPGDQYLTANLWVGSIFQLQRFWSIWHPKF